VAACFWISSCRRDAMAPAALDSVDCCRLTVRNTARNSTADSNLAPAPSAPRNCVDALPFRGKDKTAGLKFGHLRLTFPQSTDLIPSQRLLLCVWWNFSWLAKLLLLPPSQFIRFAHLPRSSIDPYNINHIIKKLYCSKA
jgi:hypothetical protein